MLIPLLTAVFFASSNAGTYRTSTGFEIWTIDLKPDGKASYQWKPDHAGGIFYQGSWRQDGPVVALSYSGIRKGRRVYHTLRYVPVRWGDRSYLIYEDEVRDWAGEFRNWSDTNRAPK